MVRDLDEFESLGKRFEEALAAWWKAIEDAKRETEKAEKVLRELSRESSAH